MEKRYINNQGGQIFLLVLMALGIVLFTVLSVVGGAQLYYQNAAYSVDAEKATAIAEAGADKALTSLNKSGGSYNGETETIFGDGSYSVSVTDKEAGIKTLQVTGYIPNKTNPKVKRTIKIDASNGIGTAFNYAIQIGEGGLKMDQGSEVRGTVYSNGNIKLDADAKITGDAWVAGGTVSTADQNSDCSGSNCTDFIFGKSISGQDRFDVAQSFKPTVSQVINKITLKLKKIGNPPNIVVRIMDDKNNRPDEDQVITSGTLSASLVTTTYNFVEVTFNQAANLHAGDTYWIMLDTSANSSNYWSWSADLAQSYSRGTGKWSPNWNSSSPNWYSPSPNLDFGFQTFMGGQATYIDGDFDHRTGTIITGDAHANTLRDLTIQKGAFYQVKNNVTAVSYYPNSVDPLPKAFPISDGNMADWKQQAEDAGVFTGNINNCPSTLPAGKYVGSIRFPQNCTVVVGQPVWITGDLDIQEGVTIKLNPSFGASSGVLIVDGFIDLDKDSKAQGSGTPGSYLILLSNFNSRDDGEHQEAIRVHRDGNTGVLYAGLGSIRLSKNNHITSITAWKVSTSKDVILEYDQGLAGTFFAFGPSGAFSLIKGTYQVK